MSDHDIEMEDPPPIPLIVDTEWDYLTDEVVGSWSSESVKVLETISSVEEKLSEFFYEIVLTLEQNPQRLTLSDVVPVLKECTKEEKAAVALLVVIESLPSSPVLEQLLKQVNLDAKLEAQYLNTKYMQGLGLVSRDYKKISFEWLRENEFGVPTNNSLVESSEGFSKLTGAFDALLSDPDSQSKLDSAIPVLNRYVGHYRLNIGRCILIALEAISVYYFQNTKTCVELLNRLPWWQQDAPPKFTSTTEAFHYFANTKTISSQNDGILKNFNNSSTALNPRLLELLKFRNASMSSTEPLNLGTACVYATLIKYGAASLVDVLESLLPYNDEEMNSLEGNYKTEMAKQSSGVGASALAMAAPLVLDSDDEDDKRPSKIDTKKKEVSKKAKPVEAAKITVNHKADLLRGLLKCGMYYESLFVLSQYPYLPLVFKDIADLINEVANYMLEEYIQLQPKLRGDLKHLFSNGSDVEVDAVKSSFWNDLPSISTIASFKQFSREFLKYNNVNIGRNPALFGKLCRLVVSEMRGSADDNAEWIQYFRTVLFPAVCSLGENVGLVEEAFEILRMLSLDQRYNIYGEFLKMTTKSNPEVKVHHTKAEKQTKDTLKRLSKTNASLMMRRLAKISISNPIACFTALFQQIESYDSLTNLAIDASRFFSDFGWDVLTFVMLLRLTSQRQAVQDDGINMALWIQNLATFVGKVSKRSPKFQIEPILQFIVKKLHSGSFDTLIIVKELFFNMTGIQQISNLTESQVHLLNSTDAFKQLVYMVIQDTRLESRMSMERLYKATQQNGILSELFILLSQLPQKLVYEFDGPLKVLSQRSDDLNGIIHVLTTMVDEVQNETHESSSVPLPQLISKYGVSAEWAFELWRKHLDISNQFDDAQSATVWCSSFKRLTKEDPAAILPNNSEDFLTPELYLVFWQLSLYDINNERIDYESQREKIHQQLLGEKKKLKYAAKDSDTPSSVLKKINKDIDSLSGILDSVRAGSEKHIFHCQNMISMLELSKTSWFRTELREDETEESLAESNTQMFLEGCILPRAVHSSFDAVFAANFIFLMHKLDVPGFSTVVLLDKLFNSGLLPMTLFASTALETENLGLFYSVVMSQLEIWRDSRKYDLFALGVNSEKKGSGDTKEGTETEENSMDVDEVEPEVSNLQGMIPPGSNVPLTFKQYGRAMFNWHKSVLKDLSKSLESSEYMSRNNAIVFLKNLLGVFPKVEDHCEKLLHVINTSSSKDSREDLALASNAISGHLKSKMGTWIHMWEFFEMDEEEKAKQVAKRDQINAKRRAAEEKAKELARKAEEEAKAEAEKERAKKAAAAAALNNINAVPYGLTGLSAPSKAKPEAVATAKPETPVVDSEETKETHKSIPAARKPKSSDEVPSKVTSTETKPVASPADKKEPKKNESADSDRKSKPSASELLRIRLQQEKELKASSSLPQTPKSSLPNQPSRSSTSRYEQSRGSRDQPSNYSRDSYRSNPRDNQRNHDSRSAANNHPLPPPPMPPRGRMDAPLPPPSMPPRERDTRDRDTRDRDTRDRDTRDRDTRDRDTRDRDARDRNSREKESRPRNPLPPQSELRKAPGPRGDNRDRDRDRDNRKRNTGGFENDRKRGRYN
ncbi:unnamed protein product [Kuraishia capsulata CBS 1993]|uniref:THO complex subunit 2 n=1 Tax=Kuraishia capsulata CBS 1993 TaxID=1382522 RepID=W6MGN6_9ASCO|nr:uncharacterized protein KUCA_T00001288001 [Kuraishia capsulata CBS 1993]CDK25319.1 unnamed protein product [Kuraishia capsulata CBS 1993]